MKKLISKLLSFLKKTFHFEKGFSLSINRNGDSTKTIDKSTNINNSTNDNSTNSYDNSTVIDNSTNIYNAGAEYVGKDVIVDEFRLLASFRWYLNIPHKIERRKDGFDELNVLVPVDANFLRPMYHFYLEETDNEYNGIYMLFYRNGLVKNISLESLDVHLDNCEYHWNGHLELIGLLENDKSIVVHHPAIKEGKGKINLCFLFDSYGEKYYQDYSLLVNDDSNLFLAPNFEEPRKKFSFDELAFKE